MLCQLRFPQLFRFDDEAGERVRERLVASYPLTEKQHQLVFQVTPENVQPVQGQEPVFFLRTDDRAWTVSVSSSSVALETTDYRRFDDFLTRWIDLFKAVSGSLDVGRQTRIGLRYVNQIELPEVSLDDLRRVVREPLLGPIGHHPLTEHPIVSIQEARFDANSVRCLVRHGIQPMDNGRPCYLIDVDVYDEENRPLEANEHFDELRRFNQMAYDLFEWCVTEEQFNAFSPQDGGSHAATR